jgi:DNA-binding MarR family transcriptional regulator
MALNASASPRDPTMSTTASPRDARGRRSPGHEWALGLDLPDVGLVARIMRLNMLVTRLVEGITSAEGISPADYLVLAVLRRSPGHRNSPTQMCDVLGRSTGGMTLTLDRLEAAGWLARAADPSDRRRVFVELSATGLEISTRINDELHAWEASLGLAPGGRAAIVGNVDELLRLFETTAADEA